MAARTSNPGREMGCYAKSFSWAIDEGVQIAIREWHPEQGDSKFLTTVVVKYSRNYRSRSSKVNRRISRFSMCRGCD